MFQFRVDVTVYRETFKDFLGMNLIQPLRTYLLNVGREDTW